MREFKTKGPVTDTLIPMAALDDIVGCVIFFTTIAIVAGNLSAGELPAYMIALVVILPLVIGAVTGILAGLTLKKERSSSVTLLLVIGNILLASGVGFFFNNLVMPKSVLNFMLIGIAMIFVIFNLGAPLDYHLIMGAGVFTAIYIAASFRSFACFYRNCGLCIEHACAGMCQNYSGHYCSGSSNQ